MNQAILHASLDRSFLSVEKFARWLRAICTILLSHDTTSERNATMNYLEQAMHVLEAHGSSDTEVKIYFYLSQPRFINEA